MPFSKGVYRIIVLFCFGIFSNLGSSFSVAGYRPGERLSWQSHQLFFNQWSQAYLNYDLSFNEIYKQWNEALDEEMRPMIEYLVFSSTSTLAIGSFSPVEERFTGDYLKSKDGGAGVRVVIQNTVENKLLSMICFWYVDLNTHAWVSIPGDDALRVRVQLALDNEAQINKGEGFAGLSYGVELNTEGKYDRLYTTAYSRILPNGEEVASSVKILRDAGPDHCIDCHTTPNKFTENSISIKDEQTLPTSVVLYLESLNLSEHIRKRLTEQLLDARRSELMKSLAVAVKKTPANGKQN